MHGAKVQEEQRCNDLLNKVGKGLDMRIIQEAYCSDGRSRYGDGGSATSSVPLRAACVKQVGQQHATVGVALAVANRCLQRFNNR